jgi:hypothetical protein
VGISPSSPQAAAAARARTSDQEGEMEQCMGFVVSFMGCRVRGVITRIEGSLAQLPSRVERPRAQT